jgi:ATP-dependent RNA helicase RhlE
MIRQNNHTFNRNRFQSRGNGNRSNSSLHRIKVFNPSQVINNAVDSRPEPVYETKNQFSDFQIDETLKRNIVKKGYTIPTPIQDQSIPEILAGRDIIGIANTGTGKTAAFLIPLIDKIIKNRNEKVLIVAPTRELANQIREEFVSFAWGLNIFSILSIGGTNMFRQRQDFKRPFNLVIGTPGRIKDLLETKNIRGHEFGTVVLDEADHMVDIGFIHDITYITSQLSPTRQSLFFSATVEGKVRTVLQNFVKNPITISVKVRETIHNVTQRMIAVVNTSSKIDQLHDLLIKEEFEKVLIFGRTKHGVQKISDELGKRGFKADAIHGNKKQSQRLKTLDRFKKNEIKILLATDVAARGLDIPNVSHVINYDMPESHEAYIHRIGRTGRAGKNGTAITFTA